MTRKPVLYRCRVNNRCKISFLIRLIKIRLKKEKEFTTNFFSTDFLFRWRANRKSPCIRINRKIYERRNCTYLLVWAREREREVQVLSFPSFGSVKFSRIPWSFVVHRYQKIREFETYHRMFYLRCSLPVVVFGDLRGQRVGVTYRSNFYVEYAPEVRYFWLKVSKV